MLILPATANICFKTCRFLPFNKLTTSRSGIHGSPSCLNPHLCSRFRPISVSAAASMHPSASFFRAGNGGNGGGLNSHVLGRNTRLWLHSGAAKREVSANAMADSVKNKIEDYDNDDAAEKANFQISSSCSSFWTLPNVLTLGRVVAVPLLIVSFYINAWWAPMASTGLFVAAAITDWLDGYIARRMGMGSAFGAFLDPVADKLIVATTLVLLCTQHIEVSWLGEAPWLIPVPAIAIIGREITMSAVREWAAAQGGDLREAVAVSNLGKWKTASQMVALTILLATRNTSLNGANDFATCGVAMLYVAAGLGVWSLAAYMRGISKFLFK